MKNKTPLIILAGIILVGLSVFILFVTGVFSDSTSSSPTGYPSGNIQRPYLYCKGELYSSLGEVWHDRSSLTEIGIVRKVDNEDFPDEEWEASHLSPGQRVFMKTEDPENKVFVLRTDGSGYDIFGRSH